MHQRQDKANEPGRGAPTFHGEPSLDALTVRSGVMPAAAAIQLHGQPSLQNNRSDHARRSQSLSLPL